MNPEQALQFLIQVCGEATLPLKNYPNVQAAAKVLSDAIKPKESEKTDG